MSVTYRQIFEKYGVDYSGHRKNMKALRKEGIKTSFVSGGVKLFSIGLVAIFNLTWAWFIILPLLGLYSVYYAVKYVRNASALKRQEKSIWNQFIKPDIDAVLDRANNLKIQEVPTALQSDCYWSFKAVENAQDYNPNLDLDSNAAHLDLARTLDEIDAALKKETVS